MSDARMDGGGIDATLDVGVVGPRDTGVEDVRDVGTDNPCDPLAHVDCFFAVVCESGFVRRSAHQPYYCCSNTACQAANERGICWIDRVECPSMRCDVRRTRCDQRGLYQMYVRDLVGPDLSVFCEGGGHRSGDRCAYDRDCVPQVDGAPGRLRCDTDAGACVVGPRPAVDPGATCLWDDDCAEGERCDCEPSGGSTERRCVPIDLSDAGVSED